MIKLTELRIGNNLWPRRVLDPENTRITGYSICAKHLAYSEEELNHDWEGIPLTPEILKKCAQIDFDFAENMTLRLRPGGAYVEQYSEGEEKLPHIKYLHQLQNLVFILTGEELIVKL
jgi:hypothetical protein